MTFTKKSLFVLSIATLLSVNPAFATSSNTFSQDLSKASTSISQGAKSVAQTTENKAQELYYSYKPSSKANKEVSLENGNLKGYLFTEKSGQVVTIHTNNSKLLSNKYTVGTLTVYTTKATTITQANQVLAKLGINTLLSANSK
ncbi:hypothetical protein [Psittacicella gerlachiana]|uniref:Uncharacterized protein n=1 Tax=Psittacicella gerlachiana TaxID=2028574 RepID=A0A3A1YC54_9GAMM|nr:hypothetical protein [Psittacicella gerlachiana]RIY34750.1 hypothetical protein CKF59_04895 [Psittacicella gerlachiana]